ncbi:hypothetical protein AKJ51_00460 [candidate division MSBL1 archaeon SCGC-AAA382A20]|uniref:Peptidase S26 domain-containing protein n=1 Tax=candidate division MSBL1 archaeon SCGC-AAA382A20 TaxID=1698280 RepID=A0A133VMH2_9EURY|nr:hypothetical protein AKJ51_00460 [candidate division MSBL1 archaeon SCGC-AAA382A20]
MKKSDVAKILVIILLVVGLGIPLIQGALQPLIVLSSSMEPVMSPGDMVIVKKTSPNKVEKGDIIAFEDPSGRANVLITHRIVNKSGGGEELQFRTKGDAVEERDPFTVSGTDVVGRVILQIPFLGYLFHYGQNPIVFITMIAIPATLIVIGEVKNILKYSNPVKARKAEREETRQERKPKKERTRYKTTRIAGIFLITLIISGSISIPYLLKSGNNVETEDTSKNLLPTIVYYKIDENSIPQYKIIRRGENTDISPEKVTTMSIAPYILPPFWAGVLGKTNPYLPGLATLLLPPLFITLIFYPFWKEKIRKGVSKRRKRKKWFTDIFSS